MNQLQKQNSNTIIRMIHTMRNALPGEPLCIIMPRDIVSEMFETEYYDGMAFTIYGLPIFIGPQVVVGIRAEIV